MAKFQKFPAKLGKWSIGDHPHFRHQLQSSGFPRPMLGLMIYLKDEENLLKMVILTVMVYHSKRKQIKISQENWCTHRGQKSKCAASSCPVPVDSWTALLSQKQCTVTHTEYCHLGELICVLVSRVFYWGSGMWTWLMALMADF